MKFPSKLDSYTPPLTQILQSTPQSSSPVSLLGVRGLEVKCHLAVCLAFVLPLWAECSLSTPIVSLLTAFLFFIFKIRHSYLSLLFFFPPRNFLWLLSVLISGDLVEQGSHFSVFEITISGRKATSFFFDIFCWCSVHY